MFQTKWCQVSVLNGRQCVYVCVCIVPHFGYSGWTNIRSTKKAWNALNGNKYLYIQKKHTPFGIISGVPVSQRVNCSIRLNEVCVNQVKKTTTTKRKANETKICIIKISHSYEMKVNGKKRRSVVTETEWKSRNRNQVERKNQLQNWY